jgi:hypothetical protein
MARSVTLLPEPDSPRMQSTSPASSVKLTPLTAWTVPSRPTKRTARSSQRTSRSASREAAAGQPVAAGLAIMILKPRYAGRRRGPSPG